jgi:putative transposase
VGIKANSTDGSESRPYRNLMRRHALPHDPPLYVDTAQEVFFVTICCRRRRQNQLCHREIAEILFQAVRFYEHRSQWFVHLLVLMPDHLHCLVSFGFETRMRDIIARWKRYTATHAKIEWQRDFFDHRLRNDESWREKADYILANPVRAGLIEKAEDWMFVLFPEQR